MTGTLAQSAPASPTSGGLKRRRLEGTSHGTLHSARASVFDDLPDNPSDYGNRRRSVIDNTKSSSFPTTPKLRPTKARLLFGPDASLVLIGTKGSGLSSFAVIAATALRFRLVDTATWLTEHYGLHRSDYVKERGLAAYRRISSRALEEVLQRHGTGCVLVCGPEALEPHSQALIRAFSLQHPVIMINRDLTVIREYLGLPDTDEVLQILGQSQRLCRQISNLEFFNIPESEAHSPLSVDLSQMLRRRSQTLNTSSLLQNVKQDFLHFLSLTSTTSRPGASNLYPTAPSRREYSTSLRLRLEDVARQDFAFTDLDFGTDAIELVVQCHSPQHVSCDWDLISRSLQLIRRQSRASIIYHVEYDHSNLLSAKDEYAALLSHGLRLLPDYITIDLSCQDRQVQDLTSSVGRTQVIGHRSFSKADPSSWRDPILHKEFDRAVALGCDVVRFVREALLASEDKSCVLFQAAIASRSDTPLIAYNTGIQSKSSMVLNPTLTPVRHPKMPETVSNKSLLPFSQLMKAKFSSFIYQPLHFHLFGASVDYSLSPLMHNAAFSHLGMEHSYSIRESCDLRDFDSLIDDTFGGSSISDPFKSEVLSLLTSMSDAAKTIQAVNTIVPIRTTLNAVDHEGSRLTRLCKNRAGSVSGLHGENTDWTALYTCVSRYLSPANAIKSSSSALIIGAGGMARASVYALLRMGIKNIVLWNRTHSKAVEVADYFNALITDSASRNSDQQIFPLVTGTPDCRIEVLETLEASWPTGLAQPTVVVSTIPAHQIGNRPPPEFKIPQQWFESRTGGVIVELSYKRAWTPLLQQAHDNVHKGWICVEPLEVLIELGRAQFELFTGYPAPQRIMKGSIMDKYIAMHVARDVTER